MTDLQKLAKKCGVVVIRPTVKGWWIVEVPRVSGDGFLRVASTVRKTPEKAIEALLEVVCR